MAKHLRDSNSSVGSASQHARHSEVTSQPFHATGNCREIQIRLGDLIAPLVTAVKQRKGWIEDFTDDRVTVSADLYEVLRAFDGYQLGEVSSS